MAAMKRSRLFTFYSLYFSSNRAEDALRLGSVNRIFLGILFWPVSYSLKILRGNRRATENQRSSFAPAGWFLRFQFAPEELADDETTGSPHEGHNDYS
jgi:hypothetical protein